MIVQELVPINVVAELDEETYDIMEGIISHRVINNAKLMKEIAIDLEEAMPGLKRS